MCHSDGHVCMRQCHHRTPDLRFRKFQGVVFSFCGWGWTNYLTPGPGMPVRTPLESVVTPVGTPLMSTLLHFTFGQEETDTGSESRLETAAVRMCAEPWSWARLVSRPANTTKLPFGVYFAADTQTLA